MHVGHARHRPGPGASAPGSRPFLGFGMGLRTEYFDALLAAPHDLDWLEITSENFMVAGGKPLHYLEQVRARWPVVMHGVSMSIGGTDPLDMDYLASLRELARRIEPAWVSDHLCWTGVGGINSHDLLPLPYDDEAVAHVVARIHVVQDVLQRELVLENLSSYITFDASTMPEWDFLAQVAQRSGCRLLLDLNNVQVSARNHGFDAREFLAGLPGDRIWQFHLAGHSDHGDYCIDTHDHAVPDVVWALYVDALERFGPVSTMIERDDDFPPLGEVLAEVQRARALQATALAA